MVVLHGILLGEISEGRAASQSARSRQVSQPLPHSSLPCHPAEQPGTARENLGGGGAEAEEGPAALEAASRVAPRR